MNKRRNIFEDGLQTSKKPRISSMVIAEPADILNNVEKIRLLTSISINNSNTPKIPYVTLERFDDGRNDLDKFSHQIISVNAAINIEKTENEYGFKKFSRGITSTSTPIRTTQEDLESSIGLYFSDEISCISDTNARYAHDLNSDDGEIEDINATISSNEDFQIVGTHLLKLDDEIINISDSDHEIIYISD